MRVALIGAGRRGRFLLEALSESGCGEPVGVWDRTSTTAELVSRSVPGARAYRSISDLIERSHPDLVIVATHPSARLDVIDQAVRAGAPAFVIEKPVALDEQELDAVVGLLKGRFAAVNTQYRWMPHWQRILADVAQGELGTIESVSSSTAVALIDQGTHLAGIAFAVLQEAGARGAVLVDAEAEGETRYAGRLWPRDIRATFTVGTTSVTISAGPGSPRLPGEAVIWHQMQTSIRGTRGHAWVSLTQGWDEAGVHRIVSGSTAWPRDDLRAQKAMFADVRKAVESGSPTFATGIADSARVMRVLFAALEAAKTGRTQLVS